MCQTKKKTMCWFNIPYLLLVCLLDISPYSLKDTLISKTGLLFFNLSVYLFCILKNKRTGFFFRRSRYNFTFYPLTLMTLFYGNASHMIANLQLRVICYIFLERKMWKFRNEKKKKLLRRLSSF